MLRFTLLAATLAGSAGCLDLNLDFSHTGPNVTIEDDGANVRLTGCDDGELLGCNAPAAGVTMSATLDGMVVAVPNVDSGASDAIDYEWYPDIGLFDAHEFVTIVPRPSDPSIDVSLGSMVQPVQLPPPFSVTSPAQLSRSAGPVKIDWETLPGAVADSATVSVEGTCGDGGETFSFFAATPAVSPLMVDFAANVPAGATTCTQTLHVSQEVAGDASTTIPYTLTKIELVAIQTTP